MKKFLFLSGGIPKDKDDFNDDEDDFPESEDFSEEPIADDFFEDEDTEEDGFEEEDNDLLNGE